jgi:hypothetical protein
MRENAEDADRNDAPGLSGGTGHATGQFIAQERASHEMEREVEQSRNLSVLENGGRIEAAAERRNNGPAQTGQD